MDPLPPRNSVPIMNIHTFEIHVRERRRKLAQGTSIEEIHLETSSISLTFDNDPDQDSMLE